MRPNPATSAQLSLPLQSDDPHAFATLTKLAGDKPGSPSKQIALALLFHAYKTRGDSPRAREVANTLWAEAEGARKQLQAMGERPLGAEPGARPSSKQREKVAAAR